MKNELSNAAKPIDIGIEKLLYESIKVKKPAPLITGIAIKNENFAASFALIPINKAQEMVIPLREIPGIIAKA